VTVLVTGGTGFVGPKVVRAIRDAGHDVRVLVRKPASAAGLEATPVVGDMTDAASVRAAVDGCSHVVHLVAIIKGSPSDFERVMTQGTRSLIAAAKDAGVKRFVLMSALGTSEPTAGTVPYFRAKWAQEQELQASGLEHTIFRPSFIFGSDGGALTIFLRQVKLSPLAVPVIGNGAQCSQPIWVDDVAAHFARALDLPEAANRTFELGGPDTVDWNELYRRIAATLGKRRALVHVPFAVARLGAAATQWIPGAPLSTDQVVMLQGPDNVVSNTDAQDTFQLPLLPLDEQLRRAAA
jgi:uncharacterized protein YbjT (DUF2867 family)